MIVHTDGAARGNPGPAGIGVVVRRSDGEVVAELAEGIGPATNNVAEYRAAIEGLRLAARHGARRVTLRAESRLLIEQRAGRFRVKNPTLQRLHEEARREIKRFDDVRLEHVPRERNADADRLANVAVDDWLAGPGRDYMPDEPAPPLFEGD
ncbi:MAG TPA: ribonuclease HI family protein [Actinomycetota bacterium]|nr:ribonuclease HI family protein [Actinomycetota bacterium]